MLYKMKRKPSFALTLSIVQPMMNTEDSIRDLYLSLEKDAQQQLFSPEG